jgi:hypothetical protein
MTSIKDLAVEFKCQPHEVAAFADLVNPYDQPLDPDTVAMVRDAWANAPERDSLDAVAENRNEDAAMDALYEVVERAGYDEDPGDGDPRSTS